MPPSAVYKTNGLQHEFTTDVPRDELTTEGKTTGPSEFVMSKGATDRDKPSEAKDSAMGLLRCQVTRLQDDINEFLTRRMQQEASSKGDGITKEQEAEELEKQLLDGADED